VKTIIEMTDVAGRIEYINPRINEEEDNVVYVRDFSALNEMCELVGEKNIEKIAKTKKQEVEVGAIYLFGKNKEKGASNEFICLSEGLYSTAII